MLIISVDGTNCYAMAFYASSVSWACGPSRSYLHFDPERDVQLARVDVMELVRRLLKVVCHYHQLPLITGARIALVLAPCFHSHYSSAPMLNIAELSNIPKREKRGNIKCR